MPSLADGLAVPKVGSNAFQIAHHLVDRVLTVGEKEIAIAILRLVEVRVCCCCCCCCCCYCYCCCCYYYYCCCCCCCLLLLLLFGLIFFGSWRKTLWRVQEPLVWPLCCLANWMTWRARKWSASSAAAISILLCWAGKNTVCLCVCLSVCVCVWLCSFKRERREAEATK